MLLVDKWLDRLLRHMDSLWNMPEARRIRKALKATAALLFPLQCVCCGIPDERLCDSCAQSLQHSVMHTRRVEEFAESLPLNSAGVPMPVIAAGRYQHELAALILAYKNHQMVSLLEVLVPVLARTMHEALDELTDPTQQVLLVPVPTRRKALAARGYWPVGLMLKRVAKAHLLPRNTRIAAVLKYGARASWGRTQKGQGRQGRASVHNSMLVRRNRATRKALSSGAQMLLVDDVLTTGATLAEALRAMEGQFVIPCGAVVIASTAAPDEIRELRSRR